MLFKAFFSNILFVVFVPALVFSQAPPARYDSSPPEKTIDAGQSLVLETSEIFSSSTVFTSVLPTDESVCSAVVLTDGSRKFAKLSGLAEGVTDVTFIPQNTDERGVVLASPIIPVTLKVRVVPAKDKYLALQEKIVEELGVDYCGRPCLAITIAPIPNSKKVLISGTVRRWNLINDIRTLVVGKEITADLVVTKFVIDPWFGISNTTVIGK